jgi:hypothetical protein
LRKTERFWGISQVLFKPCRSQCSENPDAESMFEQILRRSEEDGFPGVSVQIASLASGRIFVERSFGIWLQSGEKTL